MSALAEALARYQAAALQAMGKAYVASPLNDEQVAAETLRLREIMDRIGCRDATEQGELLAAWEVLRAVGASVPVAPGQPQNGTDRSKATDAQISLMRKIAGERNYVLPDDPQLLSRDDASKVIDQMKAGEYDQAAWAVPC